MGAAAYRRYATDIMFGMDRNEVEGSSLPMTTRPVRFTVRYTTIRNGRMKSTRRHLSKTMAFRLPVGMILRFIVSPWDMPRTTET